MRRSSRRCASAIDYMLAQQEPFPPSRSTGTGTCSRPTAVRFGWSSSWSVRSHPGTPINLADALVAPDVLRPYLVNWAEVVRYFIRSVEADAAADGTAETSGAARAAAGLRWRAGAAEAGRDRGRGGAVLPMHFRKGEVALRLFTTIATLGTPQDITAQELRIESFFPMDRATAEVLRGWAAASR